MKVLRSERQDLIDALVAETAMGGITAGLLGKDEHLTDALRALFALPLDSMSLVFCGGTSLSKAHGLIEDKSGARALNENRYFCGEWSYTRQYGSVTGLRPHLQIELTARGPVLETVTCQIGSLAFA